MVWEIGMKRYELASAQWKKIEGMLPGRPDSVGVTARDNRQFVTGVLWLPRSDAHLKDLPAGYGNWKSTHKRFTAGPSPESGNGFSRCWLETPTAPMS